MNDKFDDIALYAISKATSSGNVELAKELSKQETKQVNKQVDHPSYYNKGKIEVIDFIDDQQLNFSRGSAIKYICRAGMKDDEIQDLKKALNYIQHEIDRLERNKNNV